MNAISRGFGSSLRIPTRRLFILPALAVASLACSLVACSAASGDASDDSGAPEDGGAVIDSGSDADAGMSAEESAAFDTSSDGLAANQELVTLGDSLFDFDPTIDPSVDAATNAGAIGQNIQSNLGSCGAVTVTATAVSVVFGATPGCLLANGPRITGTVDLVVSKSGSTTSIALTLAGVVVNGEGLSGQASFATTDGSTFAVVSNTTTGTKTSAATLTVTGESNSFVISGSSQVTENGVTSSLTFDNVVHVKGECYATAGTMTITQGPVTETIAFNAMTPATGEVAVTTGRRTSTTTLAPYGSCPSGSTPPDGGTMTGTDAGTMGRDAGPGNRDAGARDGG